MESKIKILPPEVVSKIAAGEVVESPASVIRELLDNALDAKAININIEVEDSGMKKILVMDNGMGMTLEDLQNCIKPHATSKLKNENDLLNIKTLGFRGEALSSIVSVAKVSIKSKPQNVAMGHEVIIEGGNIISTSEIGMHVGTQVVVEDLFYNVPARKEFLKSTQAEYKKIIKIIDAFALANPEIGFTFKSDGRQVYATPKGHQLEDRVREIMGNDNAEKMVSLFYEHPYIEVYGYISKPEIASKTRKNQYIFVNRRLISNATILSAIKQAYGSLIPKDLYPQFIIAIDLEPNVVDVNVHPRKEEVRFSDEKLVFTAIQNAIKKALDKMDLTPGTPNGQPNANYMGGSSDPFSDISSLGSFGANTNNPYSKPDPFGFNRPKVPNTPKMNGDFDNLFGTPRTQKPNDPFFSPYKNDSPFGSLNEPIDDYQDNQPETANHVKNDYNVMVVHNLYWIIESENGFVIYDQHAVHERVLYEKFLKAHADKEKEGYIQKLLTPVVLNLSFEESETLKENLNKLTEIGFEIEDFGGTSYKITALPAYLANVDMKKAIKEILDDLDEEYNENNKGIESQTNKILTYLSCRTAYKAGDYIPIEEIYQLIDQLNKSETQYTCPHGRPVKIELTMKELEKMFLRS